MVRTPVQFSEDAGGWHHDRIDHMLHRAVEAFFPVPATQIRIPWRAESMGDRFH